MGQGQEVEGRGVVGHKRQRVSISGKEPPPPSQAAAPPAAVPAPARQQEEKQEQDDQQQQQQTDQGLAQGDQSGLSSPTATSSSAFDGYRYFLLLQTGPNSSHNDCLFLGGWEMYVPTHLCHPFNYLITVLLLPYYVIRQ